MKRFSGELVLFVAAVFAALCCSCSSESRLVGKVEGVTPAEARSDEAKEPEAEPTKVEPVEVKAAPVAPAEEEKPVAEAPAGPSTVVAEIDGSVITLGELENRLMMENRREPDMDDGAAGPVDAKPVLLKMLGEKALIIEGRKGGLLEDNSTLKRFYGQLLATALLTKELADKVKVTEEEIDQKLKSDPKLNRQQAASMLLRARQRQAVEDYFEQVSKKLHLQKVRYNFPKVAQAHQRLLYRPQSERRVPWILHSQMENELTDAEKSIPLATFDGGSVTLMDWFDALNMKSPPNRPKDLNTVEGVERLLDSAIRMPIFVAEAERQGLNKDPEFLEKITAREDRILLGEVRRNVFADLAAPTEEEVVEYFNTHRDEFKSPDELRIDQIWCKDRETAQKAKSELDQGMDFESVKQKYSLSKKDKPFVTTASREGTSFKELWAAEPNQVVGPLKGVYKKEPTWRVVKAIAKTPGHLQAYSDNIKNKIESKIRKKQRDARMAEYQKELLAKYQYKIYPDRIKDIEVPEMPSARR